MLDQELLDALRQIVGDETKKVVREELKPIQEDISSLKTDVASLKTDVSSLQSEMVSVHSELKNINIRLDRIEGTQEYTLKWLDRVEQRLNPVADYFETMHLNVDK